MSINISSIEFHGTLSACNNVALQTKICEALGKISSQIESSLGGDWIVHVWLIAENANDWPAAGKHKFFLKDKENDTDYRVQSLVLSWQSLLRECAIESALALAIGRPGFMNIEENNTITSEKNTPVANPDNQELSGEWLPETPRYVRKQWIVSEQIAQRFDDAVAIIRNSEKIYKTWGFEEVDPNPRAILCFYGPAGTGKTMAAHVLAAELGRNIIAAKYSQIESKYVGDAPKNLRRVFELAKETDSILFFDEADSFLGKRVENVSSGSDQAINSLRGEMLILLEEFRGVVVFATNLVTNIDRAFESRIISKIEFELPNAEARRAMIQSKIPARAPLESTFGDAELERLVEISEGFSGRVIRSAMLMSFVKAARNSEISGEDIIRFVDFEQAFIEQKNAAENLERQYKAASGEVEIPKTGFEQKALLDVAAEAIGNTSCEQSKVEIN